MISVDIKSIFKQKIHLFSGDSWVRLCSEGSTKAKTETLQQVLYKDTRTSLILIKVFLISFEIEIWKYIYFKVNMSLFSHLV